MKRKSGERVALEIVAAKDFNHAFEIVTVSLSSGYELMRQPGFPVLRVGSRMVVPKEQFIQWVMENTDGGVQG